MRQPTYIPFGYFHLRRSRKWNTHKFAVIITVYVCTFESFQYWWGAYFPLCFLFFPLVKLSFSAKPIKKNRITKKKKKIATQEQIKHNAINPFSKKNRKKKLRKNQNMAKHTNVHYSSRCVFSFSFFIFYCFGFYHFLRLFTIIFLTF